MSDAPQLKNDLAKICDGQPEQVQPSLLEPFLLARKDPNTKVVTVTEDGGAAGKLWRKVYTTAEGTFRPDDPEKPRVIIKTAGSLTQPGYQYQSDEFDSDGKRRSTAFSVDKPGNVEVLVGASFDQAGHAKGESIAYTRWQPEEEYGSRSAQRLYDVDLLFDENGSVRSFTCSR